MTEQKTFALFVAAAVRFSASLLLIGFATTCLLCFAPGFGVDERELDSRLSNESIDQLKTRMLPARMFSQTMAGSSGKQPRATFGFSKSLNRPVRELIQQRYLVSIRILTLGLAAGWLNAFLLAATGAVLQARAIPVAGTGGGGLILCVPAGLLAYLCYLARAPAFLVVGLVIFAQGVPCDGQPFPQCSAGTSYSGCKSPRSL